MTSGRSPSDPNLTSTSHLGSTGSRCRTSSLAQISGAGCSILRFWKKATWASIWTTPGHSGRTLRTGLNRTTRTITTWIRAASKVEYRGHQSTSADSATKRRSPSLNSCNQGRNWISWLMIRRRAFTSEIKRLQILVMWTPASTTHWRTTRSTIQPKTATRNLPQSTITSIREWGLRSWIQVSRVNHRPSSIRQCHWKI